MTELLIPASTARFRSSGYKPINDLSGKCFGRLFVLWPVGYKGKPPHVNWLCYCVCGNFTILDTCSLASKAHTRSCGCLLRETYKTMNVKHGHSRRAHGMSPELRSYFHAKGRCENTRDPKYKDYGGRGIQFRFASFAEFYAELGPRPAGKYSIERINNDGHYELGNVKWATAKEQRANQRPMRTGLRRRRSI